MSKMESTFLVIVLFIGFYKAVNIGANDVANSMGTSVGSKTLTVAKAVILAAVLNFLGATLVGSNVTDTIRKGIIDPSAFTFEPTVFMYGAFAAMLGSAIFVSTSTYLKLPVSTTHAVVGGLIGFGLITAGYSCINIDKLIAVVLSWLISPLFGGILAFLLFTCVKRWILDSPTPFESTKKILPYLVFLIFMIISLSIFLKSPNLKFSLIYAVGISISIAFGSGVICYHLLKRYKPGEIDHYVPVERLFGYLQVLSACSVAFAHGANDVANAIGLVAAVFHVAQTGSVVMEVPVPTWLLAMGGIGLAIGICTFGYRVIETVGERITEITPTRGFSAEFSAATTVLICSKLGLPISTSHTIVGSVIGVGFARGINALNLGIIKNIVLSWIVTIPIAALLTIFIYQGIQFTL